MHSNSLLSNSHKEKGLSKKVLDIDGTELKAIKRRKDESVTEILGTILILSIVVGIFSVIYISVLSVSPSPPTPSVNILGKLEGNNIILEHRGGRALDLDTVFLVDIAGLNQNFRVGDYLDNESREDGVWGLGERLVYPTGDVSGYQVAITVVDERSNSMIMMSTLQVGETNMDTVVTTLGVADVSFSSAKLRMDYDFKLYSGFVRFVYKPSGGNWNNTNWMAKSGTGSYNETIVGLTLDELYYFKAQLKYDSTIIEGSEKNFTASLPTSVDTITPYMGSIPPVPLTASGNSDLDNVTLYYRFSSDNSSWDNWMKNITDTSLPWQWSFSVPNGTGYYEFYSIGMKDGHSESDPGIADARCFYNPS